MAAGRRYYRTLILGLLMLATLLWAAIDRFNIPVEEMLKLFLGAVLVIVVIILAAAVCAGIWHGARYLLKSRGD